MVQPGPVFLGEHRPRLLCGKTDGITANALMPGAVYRANAERL